MENTVWVSPVFSSDRSCQMSRDEFYLFPVMCCISALYVCRSQSCCTWSRAKALVLEEPEYSLGGNIWTSAPKSESWSTTHWNVASQSEYFLKNCFHDKSSFVTRCFLCIHKLTLSCVVHTPTDEILCVVMNDLHGCGLSSSFNNATTKPCLCGVFQTISEGALNLTHGRDKMRHHDICLIFAGKQMNLSSALCRRPSRRTLRQ